MRSVLAYHIVLTCYGFWLPNDPRGSWSDFVRAFELYRVGGPATRVNTKRSRAHALHDREARAALKTALIRPPVVWTGEQARVVAQGFADYATKNNRRVYAAAVMPDHAHLVVARDADISAEMLADLFKGRATSFLKRAGLHPFADRPYCDGRLPSPWARKAWSVFLDSQAGVVRAVRYVEANPVRAGLRPQRFRFLTACPYV